MDETEVMLADAVQALLQDRHHAERLRQVYQGRSAYHRELWTEMAAQGWLAITLAEALGGVGLQTRHAAVIAKALGRQVVPEPFISSAAMVARCANVLQAQAPDGWAGVIDALLSGEQLVAPAWQESLRNLEVTPGCEFLPAEQGGVLRGSKEAVIAAELADWLLVSAQADGQPSLWLVPARAPGLTYITQVGSDGSSVSRVVLEQVAVTEAQCLGRGAPVLLALRQAVEEALVLTSAQLVGNAGQALEVTLEYLRTRQQFGKAIGSFQSLQHLAVDVRVQLSLAQAAVVAALREVEARLESGSAHGLAASVARAKARSAQVALMAGRFGVQAHGAIGFAAEADIGLYLKAALRLSAYLGNASYHRQRLQPAALAHEENQP